MLKSHNKTIFETVGRSPIHPFPARMAPGIALEALGDSKTPLCVLDPMAGSGTVLAVARAKGHRTYGVDIDPLAVLLAGVWTRTIDPEQVTTEAAEVLDRAKRIFGPLRSGQAYPTESDAETRQFIRYWFDDYARRHSPHSRLQFEGFTTTQLATCCGVDCQGSLSPRARGHRWQWTSRIVARIVLSHVRRSSRLTAFSQPCRRSYRTAPTEAPA